VDFGPRGTVPVGFVLRDPRIIGDKCVALRARASEAREICDAAPPLVRTRANARKDTLARAACEIWPQFDPRRNLSPSLAPLDRVCV
jgi:hypothetical protein